MDIGSKNFLSDKSISERETVHRMLTNSILMIINTYNLITKISMCVCVFVGVGVVRINKLCNTM